MTRWLSIQVPLVITIVPGLILFGIGWSIHDQITQLKQDHQALIHHAESLGLDPSSPSPLSTRRRSIDRNREVDQIARDFIAIGIEFENCVNDYRFSQLDTDSRKRVTAQVNHVLSLNQKELQQLIEIIVAQPDLDYSVRRTLLTFTLQRWTELNPSKALDFLVRSPEIAEQLESNFRPIVSQLAGSWAEDSLEDVTAWFRKSQPILTKATQHAVTHYLAYKIGIERPLETFDLVNEFSEDPHSYFPAILRKNKMSVAERSESLARIREMAKDLQEPAARERFLSKNLQALVIGQKGSQGDFQTAIDTIEANDLKIENLEFIWNPSVPTLGLGYYIKEEQTGEWINWIQKSIPEKQGEQRIRQLLESWTRRDPAGAAAFASEHGF